MKAGRRANIAPRPAYPEGNTPGTPARRPNTGPLDIDSLPPAFIFLNRLFEIFIEQEDIFLKRRLSHV
jgi:hypothetical protein